MNSYWKYKNLGIFAYAKENQETAGPATEMRQALSDWNRWAKSGDTHCPLYINGTSLTALLTEEGKEGFQDADELAAFFKKHLFSKPHYTEEDSNALVNLALMHFHQAGFPFATNFCINNTYRGQTQASDPVTRIDFEDTENGLVIKEQQTYKTLVTNGKPDKITNPEKYHAKTITTSLMNAQGITLKDLEIDCQSRRAAPIFDKRGLLEKISQYIKNILIDFKCLQEKPITEIPVMQDIKSHKFNS
ncbi:MAG: hypothetical protein Q8M03_08835 [Legionella sp.]|nr:hypothetical protein [Legionella sp.]